MSLVLQEISKQYVATPQGLEQVYQNKLVEGRDYEKYDYLVGDGVAYINVPYLFNIDFLVNDIGDGSIYTQFTGTHRRFASTTYTCQLRHTGLIDYDANGAVSAFWKNSVYPLYPALTQVRYKKDYSALRFFDANCKSNGNESSPDMTTLRTKSLYVGNKYLLQYIKANELQKVSENWSLILTPVKLLTHCPPNLSSQGKLHLAGECGMVDSVSGKFYGNTNTTGNFSVYNDSTE